MDNASVHQKDAVEGLLGAHGLEACWLPPYSPRLNPIEDAFGVYKGQLQRFRRLGSSLSTMNQHFSAMDAVTPHMVWNWARRTGAYSMVAWPVLPPVAEGDVGEQWMMPALGLVLAAL